MILLRTMRCYYFEALFDGTKTFDLRLANFDCKVGDIIVFKEWDPIKHDYTGRMLEKQITYVLRSKIDEMFWTKEEIEKYGIQILSLK